MAKFLVTKYEAARRQTNEAIELFFDERDPVCIHTLAHAALQIIYDILEFEEKLEKANPLLHENCQVIVPGFAKDFRRRVVEHRNFFKHADYHLKSGRVSIEFNSDVNDFVIFECVKCLPLIECAPKEWDSHSQIFVAWFLTQHPDLIAHTNIKQAAASVGDVSKAACLEWIRLPRP